MKWNLILICVYTQLQQVTLSPCGTNLSDFKKLAFDKNYLYYAGKGCVCRLNQNGNKGKDVCGSINKDRGDIQVLLPVNNQLFICGTGKRGLCEFRWLNASDLSSIIPVDNPKSDKNQTSTVVATNDKDRRTVAFTGFANNETVLYTASSGRKEQGNNNDFVLLSIRSLEKETRLQLFKQSGLGSQIELTYEQTIRDKYYKMFDPVAGFSYDGFAYFFVNQISPLGNTSATIIRLCHNDPGEEGLLSYMDTRTECADFKIVVDVILVPGSDVILGVFKKSQTSVSFNMCTYSVQSVNDHFANTNFSSYNKSDPSYVVRDSEYCNEENIKERPSCNKIEKCRNFIMDPHFVINNHVELLHEDNEFRSFTASLVNDGRHTIALIAADNGNIKKLHVEASNSLDDIPVKGETVQAMKIIGDDVFILNRTHLYKHPLYNETKCTSFRNRNDCLNQTDPFCGWCWNASKCSGLKSCVVGPWLAIGHRNFILHSFSPAIGPVSGGTLLTFAGENIYEVAKGKIEFYVGGVRCERVNTDNELKLQCLTPMSETAVPTNVSYKFIGEYSTEGTVNETFTYMEDPIVSGIYPNRSFASGGRNITVSGSNFDVIQEPRMQIVGVNVSERCVHINSSLIVCHAPEASQELKDKLEKQVQATSDNRRSVADIQTPQCRNQDVLCIDVEFRMDGVNTSLLRQTMELVRDPVFYNFTEESMTKIYYPDSREISIEGDRINISASVHDFLVKVGDEQCHVLATDFSRYKFHCLPPNDEPQKVYIDSVNPEVEVKVGNIRRLVGFLRYKSDQGYLYLYITVSVLVATVLTLIVFVVMLRRRSKLAVKKLQNDMEQMELRVQTEFRQAFAELQTDMTDITGELVETGLPYNKFPVYAFQILFPADDVTFMTSHKIFSYPETSADPTDVDSAMLALDSLFSNKFFVSSVFRTLEQQKKLSMSEKSSFAAYLAAVLIPDLKYFSQLTKLLLEQFVAEAVAKKKHKSLFRRCESITEKLTTIWLEICLYHHVLKNRGGSALIMLVKAMQTVMEKSPIDVVTDAAKATLSYDQLLLSQVDSDNTINLTVQINDGEMESSCPVLECDTISQVKDKCLGVVYKKDPASLRPKATDVDLQWHCGNQGRLILQEEDTCPADDNYVKLMTLADYHVTDGSVMELLSRRSADEDEEHYVNYKNIQNHVSNSDVRLLVENEEEDPTDLKKEPLSSEAVKYHLVKPQTGSQEKSKMLAEAHLNKLLQTKMNIKQFVDEAIDSALDKKDIPVVVKYLFTVLEGLATTHGVDQDTLLSWKNNSYPIRFWGLLISRPRIVFDIETPDYLQPSLDIVASTFIDSFSPPQTLSKNSAPHKLLFFKDLEEYRAMVKSFHRGVSNAPVIDEGEMVQELHKMTSTQTFKTNKTSVFYEMFQVLAKFKEEIVAGLKEDKDANKLSLGEKFEHVLELMTDS